MEPSIPLTKGEIFEKAASSWMNIENSITLKQWQPWRKSFFLSLLEHKNPSTFENKQWGYCHEKEGEKSKKSVTAFNMHKPQNAQIWIHASLPRRPVLPRVCAAGVFPFPRGLSRTLRSFQEAGS